jgi:ectoine hydroxylase-related dioxygenase (phytanoyl-CoA dioxygenase family)
MAKYRETNDGYIDDVERNGFAVIEHFVDSKTIDSLLGELANAGMNNLGSQRSGRVFGLRNLLNAVPFTHVFANSASIRSLVEPILGSTARVVRAIYFDKHKDANWKVSWHQDVTIAVREKLDVDGFSAWSVKAGITHVQPPVPVLSNMLTVRVHLDHTAETNGALRVIPATHRLGRLDSNRISYWKAQQKPVTCSVRSGGVVIMRPLLLHSSLPSVNPQHRRVLHFEYSADDLPGGLEWFSECGPYA